METEKKYRCQRDDVLNYLKEHKCITQLDAYKVFPAPITRLSAIIFELRKEHYIQSKPFDGENCYGKYYSVIYFYNGPKEEDKNE